MAYNNYSDRPVAQKQDITGWVAHIQDLTDNRWKDAEIQLIWQQQPKEMQLVDFCRMMYIAVKRGLDPLLRQIYATCRWSKEAQAYVTAIEATIDGFRLACDRTGEVDGMTEPEFEYRDVPAEDGTLVKVLHSCKISLFRKGCTHPFTAKAFLSEYSANNSIWNKMPHQMLAKCYSRETEVLTDLGFQPFSTVTGRVLQVTDNGLEPTDVVPFVQEYTGDMVTSNADMLNFSVTPNHDMITTFGKAEANALYSTARSRPVWQIPMTISTDNSDGLQISDDDLELAGYIAADGYHNGHRRFNISVSRPYKIRTLDRMNADSTGIKHSRGMVAVAATREIRSNFDKKVYTFAKDRVSALLNNDKTFVLENLLQLNRRQARLLIDAWQKFDGATNKKTGVRRLYTSRPDHVAAAEVLAVKAGYSVNVPRITQSDISSVPGFCITIGEPEPIGVVKPVGHQPGLVLTQNSSSEVWCVTVPSGVIVVRRNGFSMLCGNCCEALLRRMAFPEALSGIYSREEMMQSDDAPVMQAAVPAQAIQPVATIQPVAISDSAPSPTTAAVPQLQAPQAPQGPVVQTPAVTAPQVADPNPGATTTRRRRTTSTPPAPVPEIPLTTNIPVVPVVPDKFVCADTGQPIVDYTNEQGKYTRDWLYEYSVRTYGRALCAERLMALKTAADAAKAAAPPEATPQQVLASQAASILNGPVNGVAGA